jgi:hypothetical protein
MLQQKFLILDAPMLSAHTVQPAGEPAPLFVDGRRGAILEDLDQLVTIFDRTRTLAHG